MCTLTPARADEGVTRTIQDIRYQDGKEEERHENSEQEEEEREEEQEE